MLKRLAIGAYLSAVLLAPSGCATRTVVTADTPAAPTVVVEEHHDHESGGLFGIIGDIIALPFRAVGALLDAIF